MATKWSEQVHTLQTQFEGSIPSAAYLLCDRHNQEQVALYYENAYGSKQAYTYGELHYLSAKFAGVLRQLNVQKGDRVATLLPKGPELIISVLALWRLGAIHVPLFTAFGPQAISYRLENSGACLIITDTNNQPKLAGIEMLAGSSSNDRVIIVEPGETENAGGCHSGGRLKKPNQLPKALAF